MKLILLYGSLGKKFGKVHKYDVKTPAEAVKAMCATLKGFKEAWLETEFYKVSKGGKEHLNLQEAQLPTGSEDTIRFTPIVGGSGGALKVVVGVALIWASGGLAGFGMGGLFASSLVTQIGMSLVMGGIAQMLFSPPETNKTQQMTAADNKPSFYFNGSVNNTQQGNPVPICYGRLIVGSQVISAGLSVENK